ncbi:C/D box methylation guide ribonucleoprotein complex aNOP56 subunit, partial [Candidatus Micrarchaeota archaeon]|nr:C/D box methylation guide ribonucleoprotein complex aNOP56 subunit [Candidatus Micrarchaeota archaeon]
MNGAKDKKGKREKFVKKSKFGTMEALKSRDMLLGYVAKSIDGMDEALHLMTEKLEDVYSTYFPELKLEDKKKYAMVAAMLDKKNIDMKNLEDLVGAGKAKDIAEKAGKSLGADLKEDDMKMVRSMAAQIVELHELRANYEKYQENFAEEVCPNMKYVSNAAIAAKLIAHTGSLRKLAMLPASTIQVLGAEKALFKHLRSKG